MLSEAGIDVGIGLFYIGDMVMNINKGEGYGFSK